MRNTNKRLITIAMSIGVMPLLLSAGCNVEKRAARPSAQSKSDDTRAACHASCEARAKAACSVDAYGQCVAGVVARCTAEASVACSAAAMVECEAVARARAYAACSVGVGVDSSNAAIQAGGFDGDPGTDIGDPPPDPGSTSLDPGDGGAGGDGGGGDGAVGDGGGGDGAVGDGGGSSSSDDEDCPEEGQSEDSSDHFKGGIASCEVEAFAEAFAECSKDAVATCAVGAIAQCEAAGKADCEADAQGACESEAVAACEAQCNAEVVDGNASTDGSTSTYTDTRNDLSDPNVSTTTTAPEVSVSSVNSTTMGDPSDPPPVP